MKNSQVITICSAIYIAPHVTSVSAVSVGIFLSIWALVCVWKES
jgi:hypothetical protein